MRAMSPATAWTAESAQSAESAAELFVRNADRDDVAACFEDRSYSWRELALESRRRAALWTELRDPAAPPHLGVLLDNTACQALITSDAYAGLLVDAPSRVPDERVLHTGTDEYAQRLVLADVATEPDSADPDDLYLLIFTSGSTGF